MTGLCTCRNFKIVPPWRSTHVFKWMCEPCKANAIRHKQEEVERERNELQLLRKVMRPFPSSVKKVG